jgi:hypothetical protein
LIGRVSSLSVHRSSPAYLVKDLYASLEQLKRHHARITVFGRS